MGRGNKYLEAFGDGPMTITGILQVHVVCGTTLGKQGGGGAVEFGRPFLEK